MFYEGNSTNSTKFREMGKRNLFTRFGMILVLTNILSKEATYGRAIAKEIQTDPATVQDQINKLLDLEFIKIKKTKKKQKYNIINYEITRLGLDFIRDDNEIIELQAAIEEIKEKWQE